jgi:hypothetical protein
MDHVKPSLQGGGASGKHGPVEWIDMIAAMIASVGRAAGDARMFALHVAFPATGYAIRPAQFLYVLEASVIIRKFALGIDCQKSQACRIALPGRILQRMLCDRTRCFVCIHRVGFSGKQENEEGPFDRPLVSVPTFRPKYRPGQSRVRICDLDIQMQRCWPQKDQAATKLIRSGTLGISIVPL